MNRADDAASDEHMWRLTSAGFGEGAVTEYVCELCLEHLVVGPGDVHPQEC